MKQFLLVTHWHLDAPIERVWDALASPEQWPQWWRYVHAVAEIEKGNAQGIGTLRRYTWSSQLPYRLSFEMRTTALERPRFIDGVAVGGLIGTDRWRLDSLGNRTLVQYEWIVVPGKKWMRLFAPMLAPRFAWNHDQVICEGARGLARHLGVAVLAQE